MYKPTEQDKKEFTDQEIKRIISSKHPEILKHNLRIQRKGKK